MLQPKYHEGQTLVTPEGLELRINKVRIFPERVLYTFDVVNQQEMKFPFPTAAYFERELDRFEVVKVK
jgi:hypothetical protein